MNSLSDNKKTAIGVVFSALLIFGAGYYYGNVQGRSQGLNATTVPPQTAQVEDVDMKPFWETWKVLNKKFVPPNPSATSSATTTPQDRVWGAIKGMTASLGDPYTVFLPPKQNKVFQGNIEGEFGGVGMEIGKRDGVLTVISPLEGTPAKRAGLKPGDKIIAVNSKTADDMSVERAVQLIRGKVGTDVTLTVLSEGDEEPRDVTITRSTIQVPTIDTEMKDGAFVISLHNFSAQSAQLFEEALRDFRQSGEDDLVIDLRGNAGGFLQAAVSVASHFLDEGKMVVKEEFGKKREPRVHESRGFGTVPDSTDVAVLINGGSASASEIVAGALRDHGIAKLVGTQTFGKGSVQELVEITDKASLKVTVARWVTPDGKSISEGGLTPDVVIEASEKKEARDLQLQRAIEEITDN